MTFKSFPLYFLIFFLLHTEIFAQLLTADLTGSSSQDAEEIANKTYVQEQTELQRSIFKSYNRKLRPIHNQSLPVQVAMHIYIMHFAVNQMEQTITLNGHIYMTWIDEMAVWDPAAFNNIRTTMAKQWDLWQPDLKVANSVSGVNQYFEISKRSHTTLTSLTPTRTKIEVYPTFAMRIGCHFSYSDYPFDEQNCAMRLYTTQVMSEVELQIYYNLSPSVMLGWGWQAAKRHISDWELLSVTSNLTYYKNRRYISDRPSGTWETQNTWTLVLVWIKLKRNMSLFWMSLAIPAFISTLLNIGSFLVMRLEHSVLIVILNIFIQNVFMRDVIKDLPPVVGTLPRIVRYINGLLVMTLLALAFHLFSYKVLENHFKIPPHLAVRFRPLLKYIAPPSPNREDLAEDEQTKPSENESPTTSANAIQIESSCDSRLITTIGRPFCSEEFDALVVYRNCCLIVYLFITLCLLTIFLL